MPTRFSIHDLLRYDEKYSVLICRECKYAIQKSALGSHLLRHKIYRGERQRLLASIAQLQILEPDDLQPPPAGSPPVDGLPVLSGFRCTATGCKNLCASSKRMRRHWSERHGVSDPPNTCAHPVSLQTFFRGNKLRYFEVMPPENTHERQSTARNRSHELHHILNVENTPISLTHLPISHPGPSWNTSLEALKYFHHFTTATSFTLPAEGQETAKYWHTDVVAQALQVPWLMCGLLGISASHLATLTDEDSGKAFHQERTISYLQVFSAGWEDAKRYIHIENAELARIGAHMFYIHLCCRWSAESPAHGYWIALEPPPFQLQLFMTVVQSCANPQFALFSQLSHDDDAPEKTFAWARHDLMEISGIADNAPSALIERLRNLPYRMVDALGKPESAMDVVATLAAIDALVECCSLSYHSNDDRALWLGMVLWFRRVSDRFKQLLRLRNVAALILLAHWALLVERAEHSCWFLKGSVMKVRRQIEGELPADRRIRSLVEDLLG